MLSKNLSFAQARDILIERAGLHGMPSVSAVPNAKAAMGGFLESLGLDWQTVIGATLRDRFDLLVSDYRQGLLAGGASKGHIRNMVCLLGAWVRLVKVLDYESAIIAGAPSPFAEGLQLLFKDGSHKIRPALKAAGIGSHQFRDWKKGKSLPMRKQLPRLTLLEEFCGKPPGYLTSRLPPRAEPYKARQKTREPTKNKYRIKHKKLLGEYYRMPCARMGEHKGLVAQWRELLHERTKHAPRSDASSYAWTEETVDILYKAKKEEFDNVWRLRLLKEGDKERWWDCVDGHECPTAAVHFTFIRMILGWAERAVADRGLGMPFADLSLAICADKEKVLRFSGWRIARSGSPTPTDYVFLVVIASMLSPSGYLTMNPKYGASFGIADAQVWRKHCEVARGEIWKNADLLWQRIEQTRKAEDSLKGILELEEPLSAIVRGVRKLYLNKESFRGLKRKFWGRDLLLLTLTMSNPLRVENLCRLTYKADNSGNVQKTPTGWRIVIHKNELKNIKGEAKDKHYDQPIDPYVWPFLEDYLKIYRPMFGNSSDYLFVPDSAKTKRLYWGKATMSTKYSQLLQQYVVECPEGCGINAARHILATHVVVTSGDYVRAAHMLLNTVRTCQRKYSHLLQRYHDRQRTKAITPLLSSLANLE